MRCRAVARAAPGARLAASKEKPTIRKTVCLPLLGLGVAGAVALVAWAQEVEVTLDQVPEAVKATILCESAGGRITEIERETKNDVTVWRAIVLQRGGSIAAQAEEGESRIAMRLPGGG